MSESCDYCLGGFLYNKNAKDTTERCETAVPCPVCEGTGFKEHSNYHQYVKDVIVEDVGQTYVDPNTYCPKKKHLVQFMVCYETQQDGRPPRKETIKMVAAYQLGKKAVEAFGNLL